MDIKRKPAHYWTLEKCQEDALNHNSKSGWKKSRSGGFYAAHRNDWVQKCCKHMRRPRSSRFKWSLEACQQDALQFTSKKEWESKSPGYQASLANGWMNKCCRHMTPKRRKNGYWSLYRCKKDALNYPTKAAWQHKSYGYSAALAKGWLSECCAHMNPVGASSRFELELLSKIKEKYSDAVRKYFKGKKGKDPFRNLELDIFIPSLNLGIEFNGKYWHGKGLKRRWCQNADEYHQIKRDFFSRLNIDYLEISELDWIKNKQLCIEKAFYFLNKNK